MNAVTLASSLKPDDALAHKTAQASETEDGLLLIDFSWKNGEQMLQIHLTMYVRQRYEPRRPVQEVDQQHGRDRRDGRDGRDGAKNKLTLVTVQLKQCEIAFSKIQVMQVSRAAIFAR